jgi:Cys-tRNA(Pro)/Cys-tRNA(Cys) deacylase
MAIKNNVTRMLDAQKVQYTAHELPQEKLGAVEAAELLGVPASLVYKTIVSVHPANGKPILAVIPGNRELDLKALASALGEKKIKLASQNQAEELTGLQTGGISPLALLHKNLQVVVDQSANDLPKIFLSGGQRGLNIQMAPGDMVRITKARWAAISANI